MAKRRKQEFRVASEIIMRRADGSQFYFDSAKFPDITPLQIGGDTFAVPYRCPKCHQAGMVLLYMDGYQRVDVICGPREDAHGRYVEGCHLTAFSFPCVMREWERLLVMPLTQVLFFCSTMLGAEHLFADGGEQPIYPMIGGGN